MIDVGVAVLRDDRGRVLLVRRPEHGLLAGMWELPGSAVGEGAAAEDGALRAARGIVGRDVALRSDEPVATVTHAFSHRTERYCAFAVEGTFRLRPSARRAWYEPGTTTRRAIPRAQQRLLAAVR